MPFPANSRYHPVATKTLELPDGRVLIYLARRFAPAPARLAPLLEHVVVEGDRLDNVTARYLGDPEQFWRVCDANAAMRPDELTESVGRSVRITLPEGIPGAPDAS
jgi:hypothetical protein